MSPTPEDDTCDSYRTRPMTGDEVVISGISGTFPNSDNVKQFMDNLYNKVDMISNNDKFCGINHPEMPKHIGKISELEKFDAQFFRVTHWQASTLDPMSRKLMEHTFSAMFDAGINPVTLDGTKLGVFTGSFTDGVVAQMYDSFKNNSFVISGCSKTMMANRISYWINAKGPSYAVDAASTSSMTCLELAYQSIKSGQCDAAIVGGANTFSYPNLFLNLKRAGHLCLDGKTKCFDKNGDGYVRSEAVSVVFLQKAKYAKRIYVEVLDAKGKYFAKPDDLFLPIRSSKDLQQFLKEFYSAANVSPDEVEYVEAFGSGIAEADGNELEAIGNVFGEKHPIKVGSVISNMGNSDVASGVCALTKVCLAYQQGKLPANLHYHEPQDHIPAVRDGTIQVLTENTPFNRGYTAINNFSYTGCNYHVLLKGHYKQKRKDCYKSAIPHVVLVSGRNDTSVDRIVDALKNNPVDPEQIALLHNIYQYNIPGHTGRGYIILDSGDTNEAKTLAQNFNYYSGETRPIWFLYSGMGSQWAGMGAELMRIPIFAAAIERCRKVLEPKGVDIVKIITDPNQSTFDNILNSFVGIAAVQIGLTDVLKALGIVPDKVIGHSVGEVGCAYADGCFTAEETILASYYRGVASVQTKFIRGSMAAIGLGYKDILPLCPPEIQVACHNSSESSTISGPADLMQEFVANLTSRGIFAKEVPCANIAYHSKYIAHAGPLLLSNMKQVVTEPKPRSKKWLCTSVPQDQWDTAKYASAEYFTNNLLSPVYFEETARMIPHDAIVIEIAPHGLLQAIVKRSHKECVHVPLTRRGHKDPVTFFLEAIGKLYQVGLNFKVQVLYPEVKFPVSIETPNLSELVVWEHSEDWNYHICPERIKETIAARDFVMSVHDDEYKYFDGHVINGENIFPEAAILVLLWETLASYRGVKYQDQSVVFENVQFYKELILMPEQQLKLNILIQRGRQRFEVLHEDSQIVSGFIYAVTETGYREQLTTSDKEMILNSSDIYKLLGLRGYSYKNKFQSIHSINFARNKAQIKWTGDWVTFLDSLIQFNVLARDHDGISSPKFINSLSIDIKRHRMESKIVLDDIICYNAELCDKMYKFTKCAGVKIQVIDFNDKPKEETDYVLLKRTFIPYMATEFINMYTAMQVNLQIVAENAIEDDIKITELYTDNDTIVLPLLNKIANEHKLGNLEIDSVKLGNSCQSEILQKSNVLVVHNLLQDKNLNTINSITNDIFIICIEKKNVTCEQKMFKNYDMITCMSTNTQKLILLKKKSISHLENVNLIKVEPYKSSWISLLDEEIKKNNRIILVSEKNNYTMTEGIVKILRKEKGKQVSLLVVEDTDASPLNLQNTFYTEQLNKNVVTNILKKGQWGNYYYLSTERPAEYFENVKLLIDKTRSDNADDFVWAEASPLSNSTSVKVSFSGLSLKDCQRVVEKNFDGDKSFGMDFSGYNNRNERVMGVVSGGAVGSTVEADPNLLWPVPEHWSLEDAATVPLPFLMAYYCLTVKGQLYKSQSVLVTGGAGALGQAVISICLSFGCAVFTTVSNDEKKRFLLQMFPELNEHNIISYSRHSAFGDMLVMNTKNQRCDFVINCGSGVLREAAMKCVGYLGFFLDLSDHDSKENCDFKMFYLEEERSYKCVNVSNIFRPENIKDKVKLQKIISEGIAKGWVRPISRVTYLPEEVSRAFRLLSSSGHRGRVLIKMNKFTDCNQINVKPSIYLSPNAVYIVVCDVNGLGIELIDCLVTRGARKIVLHINSNVFERYIQLKTLIWKKSNVIIETSSENLVEAAGCQNLIKTAFALGSVEGIFIIQNNEQTNKVIEQQGECEKIINETSAALTNLDLVCRQSCATLSYFVIISSSVKNACADFACGLSENICEERINVGLPALLFRVELPNQLDRNIYNHYYQAMLTTGVITSIFSALETSLKHNYKNALVQLLKNQKKIGVLTRIAKYLDVPNINDMDNSKTISDFKLDEEKLKKIKKAIQASYKINLYNEELTNMSIASLIALENKERKQIAIFNNGLGAFYNNIPEDQYMATEPIITMKTQLSNVNERDEELDPKNTYLMMIPGFEGHHQIFTSLSERLKIRAVTIQLDIESENDSIQKIAMSALKNIKSRFQLDSKFYLLGYSFGVNVALELAALLEKEGRVGVVYCLDSSPDALRVQLKAYMGDLDDHNLQNTILEYISCLAIGNRSQKLKKDLEMVSTWSEKVDIFISGLKGSVSYSHQYLRSIVEAVHKRIVLAMEYDPCLKLESELVLMKGTPHPSAESLADDYNLSKYSKQQVRVFDIEADHALAPHDCKVANIINRLLDPQILEEFKRHNCCDFYYK